MTEHRTRKRLGQHFLIDAAVVARILAAFAPRAGERIVEIGPGRGALTDALAACAAHVTAVELDQVLAARLQQRYADAAEGRITVVHGDILTWSLRDAGGPAHAPLRLVGNLPYRISTPLIFRMLAQAEIIQDMVFMLQREVAQRLAAAPGNRHYGRLTVMAAVHLDCTSCFDIPPEAFHPPPKVTSTVVRLQPRATPLQITAPRAFDLLVRAAFAQRRKTLRNALKGLAGVAELERAAIDPGARAETVAPDRYAALAAVLGEATGGDFAAATAVPAADPAESP